MKKTKRIRIGISGTGFVARGVYQVLGRLPEFHVTGVLTRRPVEHSERHFPDTPLTNSAEALATKADIVLECSGNTVHAAEVLTVAGAAGASLVTLSSEAQVTIGSALLARGYRISEAHGDQPGALAALDAEAREMGFKPLAYVNIKGFYNPDPSPEDMAYWAKRQNSTVRAITSYTDGTKLQIEQVLVANGLGARIVRQGMIGGEVAEMSSLDYLADAAREFGAPISDFVVHPPVKGVLILADNPLADLCPGYSAFSKIRTREGRAYSLLKLYYLVYLEIPKTLRRIAAGGPPLITNGLDPTATIAAVTKRALTAGTRIETALGGFELRGEAVEIAGMETSIPITLLDGARLRRSVEPGETLHEGDVDLPETLALSLWRETMARRASRPKVAQTG